MVRQKSLNSVLGLTESTHADLSVKKFERLVSKSKSTGFFGAVNTGLLMAGSRRGSFGAPGSDSDTAPDTGRRSSVGSISIQTPRGDADVGMETLNGNNEYEEDGANFRPYADFSQHSQGSDEFGFFDVSAHDSAINGRQESGWMPA